MDLRGFSHAPVLCLTAAPAAGFADQSEVLAIVNAGRDTTYAMGSYRHALGVSVDFDLSSSTEIRVTGAWAEQSINGGTQEGASYLEPALRSSF